MARAFKTYSIPELESHFAELKLPKFRVNQVLDWVYAKNAISYDEMTNLPKTMREQLSESLPLDNPQIIDKQVSSDGTRKYLIVFGDGALVETVGLPSEDGRLSICCSSQSGCAMNCSFCATGKGGFNRNLFPGEIIDQINVVASDFKQRATNIVVMGQGEPFANYNNVIDALKIANNPKLLGIGARHITLSTCGIISGIEKFSEEPEQYTLAVSLHAARQSVRDEIMPAVKSSDLQALRDTLVSYTEKTGRRFSFEYALMRGINDSREDLLALASYARGLLCHVNLIPLNEIDGSPYKPVSSMLMLEWSDYLNNHGVVTTIRRSRGSDIAGACGQLANKKKPRL